jgi:hypothetical protein
LGEPYQPVKKAASLDAQRYPSFYRALTLVDKNGQPPAIFREHVEFAYGAG